VSGCSKSVLRSPIAEQARLQYGSAQRINAQDQQRFGPAGQLCPDLERGAYCGNLGSSRELRIEIFGKFATTRTDAEIGFSGKATNRQSKLGGRGVIDGVHANAKRNAKGDGRHGET
jgi:hypothetical protein